MNCRPRSVTIISWLFIAAGGIGFAYHLPEFASRLPLDGGFVAVLLIRLVAVVGGVFMLRGANWARWLMVGWMAYHVGLSAAHSIGQLAMHTVLFGAIAYFLFRPPCSAYFRGVRIVAAQVPADNEKPVAREPIRKQ